MGYTQLTLDYNKVTATKDSDGSTISTDTDRGLDQLFNGEIVAPNITELLNADAAFTLEYDFGANNKQYIGDIRIRFGAPRPTAYTIQVSENGTDYVTIHTVSSPSQDAYLRIYGGGSEPGLQNLTSPKKYQKWKFNFTGFTDTNQVVIRLINVYIIPSTDLTYKDYNVEFDDALLDLEGWKNPRYEGSKLTGVRINQFNQGDISYGLNPVIERKTACIFLGKDIDEGIANDQDIPLAEIINHSYLTINKILFIDLDSDEVEIVSRENMSSTAFNRIISDNFPEGSTTIVKSLEEQADKLKTQHTVKFNRGQLMKIYSYVANEEGYEDGVFGGHEVWEHKGTNQPVLSGSGLFGYGQTAADSQSLFNTNSLLFTTLLPSELNFYEGNYSTATMGSTLTNITASISGSSTSGFSIWDGENEAVEIDPIEESGGN